MAEGQVPEQWREHFKRKKTPLLEAILLLFCRFRFDISTSPTSSNSFSYLPQLWCKSNINLPSHLSVSIYNEFSLRNSLLAGSSQIIAQYYQFIRLGFEGYKNIMENCMGNAMVLKEGLEKTGRFEILSKEVGVPLVAFALKDASRYSVFDIADHLRRFSWIVPAYTMPANAERVAVLRVVVREDFSRSLAERLVNDISRVLEELDAHPVHVITKAAHVTVDKEAAEDGEAPHKGGDETELRPREITTHWRKLVDRKKTKGVC